MFYGLSTITVLLLIRQIALLEIKGEVTSNTGTIKWLSENSLEISWAVRDSIANECEQFIFTVSSTSEDDIVKNYPKPLRHAVIENITREYDDITGVAIIPGKEETLFKIDLGKRRTDIFEFLCSQGNQMFGCFDEYCHEIEMLFMCKSKIKGISYGNSTKKIFALTANELIHYDVGSNYSIEHNVKIEEEVVVMRFDRFNQIMNVGTPSKIYQLHLAHKMKIYNFILPKQFFLQDLVSDPINGFIHILYKKADNSHYFQIPSVFAENKSLSSAEMIRSKIENPLSIIQSNNFRTLEILTMDNIIIYSLRNVTFTVFKIKKTKTQFNTSFKFERYSHGYLAWSPNNLYALEQQDRNEYVVNHVLSNYTLYTNALSVIMSHQVPELPMEITQSYFGNKFVILRWNQKYPHNTSSTRWDKWNYTIEITSNNSIIYKNEVDNTNYFAYHSLEEGAHYLVRITNGPFSLSINGTTLYRKAQSVLTLLVCTEKSIEELELSISNVSLVKRRTIISKIDGVQRILVYLNRTILLLRNGSILKGPHYSDLGNISKWKQMEYGVQASKMEIDANVGNIYYIGKKDNMVYRIRPTQTSRYKIDRIIPIPVNDFVLYQNENLLTYTNESGTFGINVNGYLQASILSNKTFTYHYSPSIKLIKIGTEFRIISNYRRDIKWRVLSFGVSNFDNGIVSILSFCGNGSLILWNNSFEIFDVSEPETRRYVERLVPSVNSDGINITRTTEDRLIISWWDINIQEKLIYHTNVMNEEKYMNKISSSPNVDVTETFSCSDNLTVEIRPCSEGTCGELIQKILIVPCTTAPSRIGHIFAINKKSPTQNKERIEIYSNISINANTDVIDHRYKCFMKISFLKDNIRKLITNENIKCLRTAIFANLIVDKLDKFLWSHICLTLAYRSLYVERCQDLNFWESTPDEINLPKYQNMITTFTHENVSKIFKGKEREALYLLKSDGTKRSILESTGIIESFEVDWLTNTLFWAEKNDYIYLIYGVIIGTNKRDLSEDKVIWFRSTDFVTWWEIDSIQRTMDIKVKNDQYQYDLDAGPGWSNNILAQCFTLLALRGKMECKYSSRARNNRGITMYYIGEDKLIVLKDIHRNLCKIVHLDENYHIPNSVEGCEQIQHLRELNWQQPIMRLNSLPNKYLSADSGGQSYFEPLNKTGLCSLNLLGLKMNVEVKCLRTSAIISIKTQSIFHKYNINLRYESDVNNTTRNTEFLDPRIIDGKDHWINVWGLFPAIKYRFTLNIVSPQSNNSFLSSTCYCRTQDDIPDPPTNILVIPLNETYFKITWSDGRSNGRNISSYNIQMRRRLYITSVREFFINKEINETIYVSIKSQNTIGQSKGITTNIVNLQTSKVQSRDQDLYDPKLAKPLLLILSIMATFMVLSTIIIVCHKKRKNHQSSQHNFGIQNCEPMEMIARGHSVDYEINCLYSTDNLPLTDFDKIPHIPQSSISSGHLIGNGAFGMVFKGTMKVESGVDKSVLESVALKMRHGKSLSEDDFKREAVLLFKYSCPYIIRIYGVSFDSPERQCIILEYMEKGNLRQYLHHHRPDSMTIKRPQIDKAKDNFQRHQTLTFKDFFEMASDILEAMKFLENKKFVHRDLAARNCLVSHKHKKGRIIKLGDFGLARDIYSDEYYRKLSEKKLPIRWMSPETIKDGVFSGKSDIWSFGVLLWEIVTMGMDPYMGETNADVVKEVIAGKHLEKPQNCSHEFYEVMLQCWKYYPEQRPNFTEIDLLFHGLDEMRDADEMSTSNRLIIRSYVSTDSSNIDCDDGNNSEHPTEKTFLTSSDKYFEVASQPLKADCIIIQSDYDNFGYDVPSIRSRIASTTTEQTNIDDDTINSDINI